MPAFRAVNDSGPESEYDFHNLAILAPDPALFQSGISTSSEAGSSPGIGSKSGVGL